MPATYASLSTNERIDYHQKAIDLHHNLDRINRLYAIALTSQEKTALRAAATPILTELNNLTYDSVAGTHPDTP